ncbi:MAG TPA: hypothetical protein VLH61_02390, partial [Bacteroidales bacterium]|nr:hypothetical protein [Bacteroidales bacterium]
ILSFSEKQKFEYAGASGGFIDILGFPFCRGRIFNHIEPDHGQYDNSIEILWATGACMFVRAAPFWEAGGFDERFFAHMEEIDLCLRLQRIGYSIAAVPSSKVYHLGGGTLASSNPKKTFLNFRNSLWLMAKNWPARYFYPLLPLRLVIDIIAAFKFLLTGNASGALAILRAHGAFLARFFAMRRTAPPCSARLPEGILMGSIVLNFYLKGKKLFSQQKKFRKSSALSTL